jgi:hypothetical protein
MLRLFVLLQLGLESLGSVGLSEELVVLGHEMIGGYCPRPLQLVLLCTTIFQLLSEFLVLLLHLGPEINILIFRILAVFPLSDPSFVLLLSRSLQLPVQISTWTHTAPQKLMLP